MSKPVKIGWFSTGNGEGSYGLLKSVAKAIQEKHLSAEIAFLFCNREMGESVGSDRFLKYAEQINIPTMTFSSREFKKHNPDKAGTALRVAYDEELLRMLKPYWPHVDFAVSAGYMLVAPLVCEKLLLLNLHPALPGGPKGTWKRVVKELDKNNARTAGVTVHIATDEVDGGAALSFCQFAINNRRAPSCEFANHFREKVLPRERLLLRETIGVIADGSIRLRRDYDDTPLDMTEKIENSLEI